MKNKIYKLSLLASLMLWGNLYAQEERISLTEAEKKYTQKEAAERLSSEKYNAWKKEQPQVVVKANEQKPNSEKDVKNPKLKPSVSKPYNVIYHKQEKSTK